MTCSLRATEEQVHWAAPWVALSISKAFPSICRYAGPLYNVQATCTTGTLQVPCTIFANLPTCTTGIYAGVDAHIHGHMRANGHCGSRCCLNMGIGWGKHLRFNNADRDSFCQHFSYLLRYLRITFITPNPRAWHVVPSSCHKTDVADFVAVLFSPCSSLVLPSFSIVLRTIRDCLGTINHPQS